MYKISSRRVHKGVEKHINKLTNRKQKQTTGLAFKTSFWQMICFKSVIMHFSGHEIPNQICNVVTFRHFNCMCETQN